MWKVEEELEVRGQEEGEDTQDTRGAEVSD